MYQKIVHLVYTRNEMHASHSLVQRSTHRAHSPGVIQPYAIHQLATKKWLRYTVRVRDILNTDTGFQIICSTGITLPQRYTMAFLREGTLLAALPLKYYQNHQPLLLDYTCAPKHLNIRFSKPVYLAPSSTLNIEIVRYPANRKPSFSDINSITEWINAAE